MGSGWVAETIHIPVDCIWSVYAIALLVEQCLEASDTMLFHIRLFIFAEFSTFSIGVSLLLMCLDALGEVFS